MNWPIVAGVAIAAAVVGLLAARAVSSILKIVLPIVLAIVAGGATYVYLT